MGWADGLYKGTQSVEDGEVSGRGLGAWFLNPFVDEEKLNSKKAEALGRGRASAANVNYDALGIEPGSNNLNRVDGLIIDEIKAEKSKESQTAHDRSMQPYIMEREATRLQNQATNKRLDNQFALQYQRGLSQDKATTEARLDDLQYRRSRDRKADMQYNENIARLDRKDRKESLNTLILGLSQLGAAFAA